MNGLLDTAITPFPTVRTKKHISDLSACSCMNCFRYRLIALFTYIKKSADNSSMVVCFILFLHKFEI